MKTKKDRAAISQSMDLFIIIAAVLGVGGIVSASIYNLVSSATTSTSIIVVGAATRAGAATSSPPTAVSISIKNNGGSPISCTPSACQVVFAGTNTGTATPPACAAPCSITSGGPAIWTVGGPGGEPEANNPPDIRDQHFYASTWRTDVLRPQRTALFRGGVADILVCWSSRNNQCAFRLDLGPGRGRFPVGGSM